MTDDLVKRLDDLHRQATEERSHFYVGKCVADAKDRIKELETKLADIVRIATSAVNAVDEVQTYEQPDDPWSENALTMRELDAFDFDVSAARAALQERTNDQEPM